MSIDLSRVTGISDSRGVITEIKDSLGRVIWSAVRIKPAVLIVEKITSDTYAGETTYTGEQFILLDIYPKTNGTVKVTYGGLTKTITDTSGAEEPNAQQVFFGTFNGVSDSIVTPTSGKLMIDGDYYAFGQGAYQSASKYNLGGTCQCVSCVNDWGVVTEIPVNAFKYIVNTEQPGNVPLMNSVTIPDGITKIGQEAFYQQTSMTELVMLATNPPVLGENAFAIATFQIVVPKGCGNTYKAAEGWSTYADRIVEVS